jgi:hypothetical protein
MPRPIIHHRDHEHGGADPVRIQWEQTGESGGGSGATPQAFYTLSCAAVDAGALRYFSWEYVDGDGPLLDLSGTPYVAVLDAGVYAYTFSANWAPPLGSDIAANFGSWAEFAFAAVSSSGDQTGDTYQIAVQHDTTLLRNTIHGHAATTTRQDAGGLAFVHVTDGTTGGFDYVGSCFIQKVA